MYTINQLQEKISQEIGRLNFDTEPQKLYEPIKYTLEAGGKRIRPALVLAACNLFSENIKQAVPLAMAFEVFHNFTLLHDDIMDNSPIRRNKETVHKKWDVNTAILSGDAMMILAYSFLNELNAENLKNIFPVFNKTALQVCEGQQYDMNFEHQNKVTEAEYLEMIKLKTSVLIAAALQTGAICGGADKVQADLLYEFGMNIGLAFQIQDDLLDVYADTEQFGKQTGNDILTEKKTFLLIHALEQADTKTEQKLTEIIRSKMTGNEKITQVKNFYDSLNIKSFTEQKILDYHQKATDSIKKLNLPVKKISVLLDFADLIMSREK